MDDKGRDKISMLTIYERICKEFKGRLTEQCYTKPKKWVIAAGVTFGVLMGTIGGVIGSGIYFNKKLEDTAANVEKAKADEFYAKNKELVDIKTAAKISQLEQDKKNLESTVQSLSSKDSNKEIVCLNERIYKLAEDFEEYRKNYPETLLREKSSLESQLAAAQKELDEAKRFTERALMQQYISKEEYAALIADRKKLEQAQSTLKQVEWELENYKKQYSAANFEALKKETDAKGKLLQENETRRANLETALQETKKRLEDLEKKTTGTTANPPEAKKEPTPALDDSGKNVDDAKRKELLKEIDLCTRIIESDPGNRAAAYNNRGNIKQQLGMYKEAIADYDAAIKEKTNYSGALNNRGIAKKNLNDLEGALNDYNKAIELDKNNEMAHFNRGNIYFMLEQFEEAIQDYDKTIKLKPDHLMAPSNKKRAEEKLKEQEHSLMEKILIKEDNETKEIYVYFNINNESGAPFGRYLPSALIKDKIEQFFYETASPACTGLFSETAWVQVRTGQNNESNYEIIGCNFDGKTIILNKKKLISLIRYLNQNAKK